MISKGWLLYLIVAATNSKFHQPKRPPLAGHTHGKVERFNFAKNSLGKSIQPHFLEGFECKVESSSRASLQAYLVI